MELVNTWTLKKKKPKPKSRISVKLTCFIASRVLNRAEQNFIDLLEVGVGCLYVLSCDWYMPII